MKYKIGDKVTLTDGNIMTIDQIDDISKWYRMSEDPWNCYTDEMIEGLVEEKVSLKLTGKAIKNNEMVVSVSEYILPEGYIIKDENGNVINTNKIVLEKKKNEYPKTFEECVHVLEGDSRMSLEQMNTFRRLIDSRNAYWKIAGNWKPNFGEDFIYAIGTCYGTVEKRMATGGSGILLFPTEEMRDAFYENFKKEIEICKELL